MISKQVIELIKELTIKTIDRKITWKHIVDDCNLSYSTEINSVGINVSRFYLAPNNNWGIEINVVSKDSIVSERAYSLDESSFYLELLFELFSSIELVSTNRDNLIKEVMQEINKL